MTNFKADVSAAAVLFLPFVLLFVVLLNVAPPSSSQLLASDPLVQFVHDRAGLWAAGVLCALPSLIWIVCEPASREALLRGARSALTALLATAFEARFFATRFVVPGRMMSLLFFRPGPAFVVTLHSSAHVGIALLFLGVAAAE